MDKGTLMKLTGLDHGVDSAIPEGWADQMVQMGLNYHSLITYYVWQYQKSPSGPTHLGEALIEKMQETQISMSHGKCSILDLVQTLLENPECVEIRIR
jgi:hypothetical protein